MINRNFEGGNLIKGKPFLSVATAKELSDVNTHGPVTLKRNFINYLGKDVVVVLRNGFRYKIPALRQNGNNTFIIRDTYCFNNYTYDEIKETVVMLSKAGADIDLVKAFETVFELREKNKLDQSKYQGYSDIVIDTNLDYETIGSHRNGTYLTNLDILVTLTNDVTNVTHPFADHTVVIKKYEEMMRLSNGFNCSIEIVDNENLYSERFIYFANNVHQIETVKDMNRVSGVYFSLFKSDIADKEKIEVNKSYMNIDDAKKILGIYSSREEALSNGDIEGKNQKELIELSHQLQVEKNLFEQEVIKTKREFETTKAVLAKKANEINERELEIKRENQILNKEIDDYKRETEMLKSRLQTKELQRDDYYSERSHIRKDSSDLLKTAPAVLLGVIGVMAALGKIALT